MPDLLRASSSRLRRHWQGLCHDIGHRTAGSRGEQRAADYIEAQLRRLRLEHVHQETFEFPNWSSSRCRLTVAPGGRGRGARPRSIRTVRAGVYSSATPPRGVRGPLAYLETGREVDFTQPLKGRIGLIVGGLAIADDRLRALIVASGLKAMLMVDTRAPFDWALTAGAAPHWVDGLHVPMAGLSFNDAIGLVEQMPLRAHLTLDARSFPATSQNVMGEIVGRTHPDEVILVSGHHDCVEENVGADDNGSGVLYMLELARIFSARRPPRTIRFISYGTEERLSIGAYLHMRGLSRREQRRIVLCVNPDSISSAVGCDQVRITGTEPLARLVERTWGRRNHPVRITRAIHPYSDHFPFNIVGVPSISLGRTVLASGGCWQLHSVHDNTDHVSAAVLARTIDTSADLIDRIANARALPFPRSIAPGLKREVDAAGRQIYRHPWSPGDFDYDR